MKGRDDKKKQINSQSANNYKGWRLENMIDLYNRIHVFENLNHFKFVYNITIIRKLGYFPRKRP